MENSKAVRAVSRPTLTVREGVGSRSVASPREMMSMVGKQVELALMTGTTLQGVLKKIATYELVVTDEDGRELVVMKHAVAFMRTAASRR